MPANPSTPDASPTIEDVTSRLRATFPGGGSASFRADEVDDTPYLFIEDLYIDGAPDEDLDKMPEERLGQDLYEALDSAVNRARDEGTLVGFTGKFYDLNW